MKKNKVLLIVIIGLMVFTSGCQATITTTSTTEVSITTTQDLVSTTIDLYDYSDFSGLFLTDPETQLSQVEDDYYLYFYGPGCTSCNTIKQEVLSIINDLTSTKVYLVETDALEDINELISISHTPSLVHVVNHLVESAYEGAAEVLPVFQIME